MIGAIKQPNGKYTLTDISFDNKAHSTYKYRQKIKGFGSTWDGKNWIDFPEDKLKEIGASKRLKIRTEPYPGVDKSEDSFTYEYQIKDNKVKRLTISDDREWVKIEEIYGEQ
jgi:hypothetical protein